MANAGYGVSSAYTMVRDKSHCRFVYRDRLWHGGDMLGTGVASFGHASGVHMQNVDSWEKFVEMLQRGELPLGRALPTTPNQQLVRELILQLKTGWVERAYFRDKFGADILTEFAEEFGQLAEAGVVRILENGVEVTPDGLLQIDRHLPAFFEPQYRGGRYT
jgi:oxygen-independent coproporphyrinogen-3 oxidase